VRFGDSQRSDQLVKLEVTEAYPVLEVVTEIFVLRNVLEFKPVTVKVSVDPTAVPMLKVP
jgi:hypothetical protein